MDNQTACAAEECLCSIDNHRRGVVMGVTLLLFLLVFVATPLLTLIATIAADRRRLELVPSTTTGAYDTSKRREWIEAALRTKPFSLGDMAVYHRRRQRKLRRAA